VQVKAGTTARSIDVVLRPLELYQLSGHVLRGSSGARVEAYLISTAQAVRTVEVNADGAFEVAYLEPGRYTLWARAELADGSEAGAVAFDLGSDLTGLVIPLAPTGEIAGRIVTEDGDPFSFAGAEIVADLIGDDGRPLDRTPRDRAAIGSDGTFHLRGLFGTRTLRLIGTQREVTEVRSGKTPVDAIDVGAGERLRDVTVVAVRR
jgi:hypothetical protein